MTQGRSSRQLIGAKVSVAKSPLTLACIHWPSYFSDKRDLSILDSKGDTYITQHSKDKVQLQARTLGVSLFKKSVMKDLSHPTSRATGINCLLI